MANQPPSQFKSPTGDKCFFKVGRRAHCSRKPYRDIWFSGKTVTACREHADMNDGVDARGLF